MTTGRAWVNLFEQRVLDLAALSTGLQVPLQASLGELSNDVWGAGGVFTPGAAFTDTASLISLTTDRIAWTGNGYRLSLDNTTGAGFASVPYQATGGVTYYLGARRNQVPAGAQLGFEGTPGFLTYDEAIGEVYTPQSVTDIGTGLRFELAGVLPAAMKWSTAGTRAVTVWKTDPVTATSQAVATGSLTRSGSSYRVDIAHYFGQPTPSTTVSDYRVHVHGLTISASTLTSNTAYVYFGTMLSGTFSATGQRILDSVGNWISAFNVEHDPATGYHTTVRAQAVEGRGGSGNDLNIDGDQMSLRATVAAGIAAIVAQGAGSTARLYTTNGGNAANVSVLQASGDIDIRTEYGEISLDDVDDQSGLYTGGGQIRMYGTFGVGVDDTLDAADGIECAPDVSTGIAYAYTTPLRLVLPMSPRSGGYTDIGDPSTGYWLLGTVGGADGLIAQHGTSRATVRARERLRFPDNQTLTAGIYEIVELQGSLFASGSTTGTISVVSLERPGGPGATGTEAVLLTLTGGTVNGGVDNNGGTPIALDPTLYEYFVEINSTVSPAPGAPQAGAIFYEIADVIDKAGVE